MLLPTLWGKCESVIANMQDNALSGELITGVVGYASPTFFASLIGHAKVQAAYQYYSATDNQSILRNRAGGSGLYREFTYAGIRFIEVRTVLAGETLIPAGDCTFVPTGTTEVFKTFRSPANKLDYVNTIAEKRYVWTYPDPKNEGIDIEAQSSFLNVVMKPKLVVRGKRTA
jgi:hypothetical protein